MLFLTYIAVTAPGDCLGGRVLDRLRDFSDRCSVALFVGPAVNQDYRRSEDGRRPRRHPWLEACRLFAVDERPRP